jgi:hypothetical protein
MVTKHELNMAMVEQPRNVPTWKSANDGARQ